MPRKASPLHHPAPRWRFPLLALLLMAAVAALFLLGEQVSAFVENARTLLEGVGRGVLGTFGLGLAIIVLVLLGVLAFKGWVILLRRWHRWMGMAVLVLALFGALSFLRPQAGPLQEATLGGRLGQLIAGPSAGLGVARVALLAYLGLLLVGPATTWAWTRGFLRVVWRALALGGRGARAFLMLLAKAALILLKALVWPVKAVLPQAKGAPAAGAPARPAVPRGATPSTSPPAARGTYPQFEEAYAPPEEDLPPPKPRDAKPAKPVITPSGWELPPLDLLEPTTETTIVAADAERRAEVLQKALSEYGVEARVVGWNPGPTVTQFEVEPGWDIKYKEIREKDANGEVRTSRQEVARTRVKVDRIKALDNDLALALAAPGIRIEAPVP
ncbi:MAG: DNA translocase FtsK, partial [Chloroflexota bacterium]